MPSVFEMMNNGQMGSLGATGAGGGNTPGGIIDAIFGIVGVKAPNAVGYAQGTQGLFGSNIGGFGAAFTSRNAQPNGVEKFFASIREGFQKGAQGSGQMASVSDIGPPSGGSWASYVSQSRGDGGMELG